MRTILKMSLDSLDSTIDPTLGRITLISNGCCPEAEKILLQRRSDLFDQIVINKENLGKVDGLLSVARGALEEIVVVSDCDVLFREGWLEEVIKVFSVFPEAGSVSPIASPRQYLRETATTILGACLGRELKVCARMPSDDIYKMTYGVKNPEAQLSYLHGQVTIERANYKTGVGNGHQCVAFRRELMQLLPLEPCLSLLEPDVDRRYLDRPPDSHGYWKLSTPGNYAFHMGNQPADWMSEMVNSLKRVETESSSMLVELEPIRKSWVGYVPYSIRKFLARAIRSLYLRRLLQTAQIEGKVPG